ncbi:hypothetical protein NE237_000219 [Protea cynaroides]|uniref:Uncharacterized protein n=1 Tax=Protea cynaroides TaxID=273540 RepID=A0A9Q0KQT9_9MAGN|nr:hypothetical protein NE237_000219 [Protea cynaroides]
MGMAKFWFALFMAVSSVQVFELVVSKKGLLILSFQVSAPVLTRFICSLKLQQGKTGCKQELLEESEMAAVYDFFNSGGGMKSIRDEEFEEDDVWSVVVDIKESTVKIRKPKNTSYVSSSPTVRRLPTASRMIPRANNSNQAQEAKIIQNSSAPVNIPDWTKIYRKNPRRGADNYGYGGGYVNNDDDDEDDGDLIPPHEWIAKKLSTTQISSFSVCEGVGRTLKGRDLSKARPQGKIFFFVPKTCKIFGIRLVL